LLWFAVNAVELSPLLWFEDPLPLSYLYLQSRPRCQRESSSALVLHPIAVEISPVAFVSIPNAVEKPNAISIQVYYLISFQL
jgi:hypothetical protein